MEFRHNPAEQRYEAWVNGTLAGEAHYVLAAEVADFDHTRVDPRFEGQGIAGRLVGFAMDEIRAAGEWRVIATCPFVVRWFERNPDAADLLG